MDGLRVRLLADRAAARMRSEGLVTPVPAVTAILREQYGGKGFDSALRDAVLRELARRGGTMSAKNRKNKMTAVLQDEPLRQQMIREAELLAFRRRDHLVRDL